MARSTADERLNTAREALGDSMSGVPVMNLGPLEGHWREVDGRNELFIHPPRGDVERRCMWDARTEHFVGMGRCVLRAPGIVRIDQMSTSHPVSGTSVEFSLFRVAGDQLAMFIQAPGSSGATAVFERLR